MLLCNRNMCDSSTSLDELFQRNCIVSEGIKIYKYSDSFNNIIDKSSLTWVYPKYMYNKNFHIYENLTIKKLKITILFLPYRWHLVCFVSSVHKNPMPTNTFNCHFIVPRFLNLSHCLSSRPYITADTFRMRPTRAFQSLPNFF